MRVPRFADHLSYWFVRAATSLPGVPRAIESVLRAYYEKARRRGLANIGVPIWYRWLRAYYFAAMRTRLSNTEFQQRYWELGSLTDYRRYVTSEAKDDRILRLLDMIVDQADLLACHNENAPLAILDVGCGGGLLQRALLDRMGEQRLNMCGLDISLHGLLLARDVVHDPRVTFVQASVTQMPFSKRFDIAFCRGVLMFLDQVQAVEAFEEIARICTTFILTEPANVRGEPVDVRTLQSSLKRPDVDQTSWIHAYPRMAVAAGGKIVSDEYVHGNYLMVVQWENATNQHTQTMRH